ncbi:MAG: glucosaminidase domain-containing protein [Schleiferiaceae bacterium]|nr:glucosaminidase domain-containing protein [Schleiferiaceae bacterium]
MRKLFLWASALLFIASTPVKAQSLSPRKVYVEAYSKTAVKEMKRSGIPASVTLAQGILESGNGQSRLSTEGNNHFGIKCHDGWNGKTMFVDDDKPDECFRVYRNPNQSFKDHSDFLTSRSRYDALFALDPRDYAGWARGLKAAGYATSPTYAEKLVKIIEEESLYLYDQQVIKPFAKGIKGHLRYKMTPNGAGYVLLEEGESLEALAFEFALKIQKILDLNDATFLWAPQVGDRIYIIKKKKELKRKLREITTCRMNEGESTWDVAQRYGIQLEALYKINAWPIGYQPGIGELIRLEGARLGMQTP